MKKFTKYLFLLFFISVLFSCDATIERIKEKSLEVLNEKTSEIDSTLNKEIDENINKLDTIINHQNE